MMSSRCAPSTRSLRARTTNTAPRSRHNEEIASSFAADSGVTHARGRLHSSASSSRRAGAERDSDVAKHVLGSLVTYHYLFNHLFFLSVEFQFYQE